MAYLLKGSLVANSFRCGHVLACVRSREVSIGSFVGLLVVVIGESVFEPVAVHNFRNVSVFVHLNNY